MLQTNPHNPRRQHRNHRERDARHPRLQEPRVVRAGPQVGRINTTHIAQRVAQRQRDRLLFWRLPQSGGCPAEHDVVDTEGEGDEDEDGDEARGDVCCHCGDDEADDDDAFAHGDVPGALVVAARSVRHDDGHGGGEEVRRTRQRERSCGVVPQRLDHRRQE